MGLSFSRSNYAVTKTPTADQAMVLSSGARVRVVAAAPGSGKTWLIAEAVRRAHRDWTDRKGGIAALSFTNVAREEVRRALNAEPRHPHTVRTLDSFLFRNVVRPFLPTVWPAFRRVKLIPADQTGFVHKVLGKDATLPVPGEGRMRASILNFDFVRDLEGDPVFSVPLRWGDRKTLSVGESSRVYRQKKKFWERTNFVTHSDVAFLAAKLLSRSTRPWREPLLTLLSQRFPELIVDELQDTGWFRAQALLSLMERPEVRALVVGDPDQAIFEFAGASPEVFRKFESLPDAHRFTMEESIRCPTAVCRVARELSSEIRNIRPSRKKAAGEAFIVPHDGSSEHVAKWLTQGATRGDETRIVLLARKNRTVYELRGQPPQAAPSYGSRAIQHVDGAVRAFRRGNNTKAFEGVSAAFSKVLFGTELIPEDGLKRLESSEFEWRRECISFVLEADRQAHDCTFYDWGCHVRDGIEDVLVGLGWWHAVDSPLAPRRPYKTMSKSSGWPASHHGHSDGKLPRILKDVLVKNIHQTKGETYDVVVWFVPDSSPQECPSLTWWSARSSDLEERRVAYVATTRTTSLLVLALPVDVLARLRVTRPQFVQRFTVVDGASDLPTQLPGRPQQLG